MATGQTSAGGGGGEMVVFGTLTENDINVTSNSVTITFPSAIKQLCGLAFYLTTNDGNGSKAFVYPGMNLSDEFSEARVNSLAPWVSGSTEVIMRGSNRFSLMGNTMTINNTVLDYSNFDAGVYAYIPE